jgi:hypothetical protein
VRTLVTYINDAKLIYRTAESIVEKQVEIRQLGFFVLISLLAAAGCYDMQEEDTVGSWAATYQIESMGLSCEEAGVATILAVFDDGLYHAEVPCDQYEISIDNIEQGLYRLTLYGLNAEGIPIMDSLAGGETQVLIQENKKTVQKDPVRLTETPVALLLRWGLGFGSCKSRGFKDFVVEAVDFDGETTFQSRLKCTSVGILDGEYRIVPDKKRQLAATEIGSLRVYPVARSNDSLGEAFEVLFEDFDVPGPGEPIEMSISCGQTACYDYYSLTCD